MAEPSLYKEAPTVAVVDGRPTLNTDTTGTASYVSPTGAPLLAQTLVKAATTVVGLAALLLPVLPEHTIAWKVCFSIVGLGASFGIASQGVRKT